MRGLLIALCFISNASCTDEGADGKRTYAERWQFGDSDMRERLYAEYYADGCCPDELTQPEFDVVPDSATALAVAKVLHDAHAEKDTLDLKEFKVMSSTDSTWLILGRLISGAGAGGDFCIELDRRSGGVVCISHTR